MKPAPLPASMGDTSGNGGGDTQVLDGGTPPLGERALFTASVCATGWRRCVDLVDVLCC
jgi:hypothetical protein